MSSTGNKPAFGPAPPPPTKLSLDEAAEKIAADSGIIFKTDYERFMLAEDFKLLVRTYVSEGSMAGFEKTMKRRFRQINGYDRVQRYNAKAKKDGNPTLQEKAKEDAAGRTMDEVTDAAIAQMSQVIGNDPERQRNWEDVQKEVVGKLMKDLGPQ